MKKLQNRILLSVTVLLLSLLTGCNSSLPPGEPPPLNVPIIREPAIKKPAKLISGNDAISYMLTSLAMRCEPIASAGNTPPKILNRFIATKENVNDIPMGLWLQLIKNNLITPISNKSNKYDYTLVSEMDVIKGTNEKKREHLWKLKLIKNNKKSDEVWNAEFSFFTK
jgi:hypothetical protein